MRLAHEIILADNFLLKSSASGARRIPDRQRFDKLSLHVRRKFGKLVRVDAPDHSATKMFDKSRILVSLSGQTRYLDHISEVVRGMSSNIWRGRIYADLANREEDAGACAKWLEEHELDIGKGTGSA